MNVFAAVRKKDYRILSIVVFFAAVLSGIVMEHLLYRLTSDAVESIVSEYGALFAVSEFEQAELVRYLLKTELGKYLTLILLSFSVLGIFGNVLMFYLSVYRYIFFMAAIYRSGVGSGYILCVCAGLLCFVFLIPAFLYCIRLSYNSYLYCKDNGKKLYHCTKYQLQTEIKIGIIILLYTALGVVVESIVCTDLLRRMFM